MELTLKEKKSEVSTQYQLFKNKIKMCFSYSTKQKHRPKRQGYRQICAVFAGQILCMHCGHKNHDGRINTQQKADTGERVTADALWYFWTWSDLTKEKWFATMLWDCLLLAHNVL